MGFAVFTPWVTRDVVRTSWGWGYLFGPGFLFAYAIIIIPVGLGLSLVAREFKHNRSPSERRQSPWLLIGIAAPLLVSAVTDVALPALEVQTPRLATSSFALMGALGVWTLLHYGYSLLTPGTFSHEILATLPDGVALVQGDARIRRANDGLVRLSGYSSQQLDGLAVERLLVDDARDPAERFNLFLLLEQP